MNSNTGYVISDDHIKIIIDIQKYAVYNRFVHRRVICSIRNNSWIRWQTEMSAFLFSFFVIWNLATYQINVYHSFSSLSDLTEFKKSSIYTRRNFSTWKKTHHYRRKNHAAVTSVCSSCIAGTLSTGYVRCSRLLLLVSLHLLLMYLRYLPVHRS